MTKRALSVSFEVLVDTCQGTKPRVCSVYVFTVLVTLASMMPLAFCQIPKSSSEAPTHGTVNVILANGDSLVAATDSMLTSGTHHATNGIKLYKIDDQTIATMASFYRERGPGSLEEFTASIPQMINDSARRIQRMAGFPFEGKANMIFSEVEFKLNRHLQTMMSSSPSFSFNNPNLMIELTIAGYDNDGSLKVAEITMKPTLKGGQVTYDTMSRPFGRYTPSCIFTAGMKRLPKPYSRALADDGPIIYTVQNSMFCEIAGLRDIPEKMLASPDGFPNDVALQAYARARTENKLLSKEQLRALAVDLVSKTAEDETRTGLKRVGGNVDIAVLSKGHLEEEPRPVAWTGEGYALTGNLFELGRYTCNSPRMPFGPKGSFIGWDPIAGLQEIEVELTNCTQDL